MGDRQPRQRKGVRLVHHDEMWDGGDASFYCLRVPLKWFDATLRERWLLYSGSWFSTRANDQNRPFYRSHVRSFRLQEQSSALREL